MTISCFHKKDWENGKLIKIYENLGLMIPNAEAELERMMEEDPKIKEEDALTNKN